MDTSPGTPPQSGPHTPNLPPVNDATLNYATPTSLESTPSQTAPEKPVIPNNLSQAIIHADPHLKRFQQDLLILTSFNENDTLHWRPSWFKQETFGAKFWALYNPPNVVTEQLPCQALGRLVYTRRMRRPDDPFPMYITTWDQWHRICDLRGIPRDFLCEHQIKLMRLGLPRDAERNICAPPTYPLYPEPQPLAQGRYMLNPSVYTSHLPQKFHNLRSSAPVTEDVEVVVVHSDGRLAIEPREVFFMHASQWTHYNGRGGYTLDVNYVPDLNAPKDQSKGRRWSYLPWTKEMEESCWTEVKLKIKLRGWNSAMME